MNQLQNILDCLNSAFAADPHAMHALLSNIVPTNEAMVDHPHMVVNTRMTPYVTLGMLGVINGLMTAAGLPRVAAKYSDVADAEGQHAFEGFVQSGAQPLPKNVHVLVGRLTLVDGVVTVTDKEIVVAESIADAEDAHYLKHGALVQTMALAYLNHGNILQVLPGSAGHITDEDKERMRQVFGYSALTPKVALMRVLVGVVVLEHAHGKHSADRKEAVMATSLMDAEDTYRRKHNLREQPVALAYLDVHGRVVVCLPCYEACVTLGDAMLLRTGDLDIVFECHKASVETSNPVLPAALS